jgi:hypothetical protein
MVAGLCLIPLAAQARQISEKPDPLGELARFLEFDPLLAIALILAVTLIVGRTVDAVRAHRQRSEEKNRKDRLDLEGRVRRVEISGASDA